jgi:hypothetical protein
VKDFGDMVRAALADQGKTQEWLAKQLGITGPALSGFLNDRKAFDPDLPVHISELLGLALPQLLLAAGASLCHVRSREGLQKLKDRAKTGAKDPSTREYEDGIRRFGQAEKTYRSLLENLSPAASATPQRPTRTYLSLEDFPALHDGNWCILIGDRRERPPQGLGDLLVLSMGAPDVMFLPSLRLAPNTIVRSDKTILVASEENLPRLLNANLLVIGSPAVSLVTRQILRRCGATFLFNIGSHTFQEEQSLRDRAAMHDYKEGLTDFLKDKEVQEKTDDILATYRKNGFVDPIDFKEPDPIRGRAIDDEEDYGVIALSENPWSERHVTCICAGVHGAGTAGALQMLADPSNFSKHPWGGVFKVSTSNQVPWERRFGRLNPRWETHDYEPEKYIKSIRKLASRIEAYTGRGSHDAAAKAVDVSKETLDRVTSFACRLAGIDSTPMDISDVGADTIDP